MMMVCEPRLKIRSAAARYGASNLRVYGLVARYDVGRASDIDLLVDMEDGHSLVDLARLHLELEDLLGISVGSSTDVRPRYRERVHAEAIVLSPAAQRWPRWRPIRREPPIIHEIVRYMVLVWIRRRLVPW